jgi:hypothetical protein
MSEPMCAICRDNLRDTDMEVYQTKCGHKFHKDCLINYCNYLNNNEDVNFSSMPCPMCKTPLNCRIVNGEDIFPEVVASNNIVENEVLTNVQKALNIIPEDEYDIITGPDDIRIDELSLSDEDKNDIFQEIERRKAVGGRRSRRISIRKNRRKNKHTNKGKGKGKKTRKGIRTRRRNSRRN